MKTIKAIIIDDEPLAHKVILTYVKDLDFIKIVGQCYLATEAYSIIKEREVDLIFLDINMPVLKGLDFLRTLDKKPHIIVTTAYQEFALEGFELQVTDYLLKPFRFDRFLKAIQIVQRKLEPTKASEESKYIFIKVDKKQIRLDLSAIQYLESYGNYVKVWIETEYFLTPRTLTSFEEELDSDFLRIHKSYIIHQKFIDYVEGNIMNMANGNILTVGKNYRKIVKELFK